MIHPVHPGASLYLLLAGLGFLLVYALPLLFVPVRWARLFGWSLPEDRRLVEYLGRCLGGVAAAIVLASWRAAADPAANLRLFELHIAAFVAMIAVHVRGALRREQPWTETAEIAVYALLLVVASVVYFDLAAG